MNVHRPLPRRAGAAAGTTGLPLALALTGCGGISAQTRPQAVAVRAAPEPAAQPLMTMHGHRAGHDSREERLRLHLRLLWEQHMEWTYATVAAFAADSKGLQPTLERLLANQSDLGAAIRPYYRAAAAARLTELLRTHINDAVPVLVAAGG